MKKTKRFIHGLKNSFSRGIVFGLGMFLVLGIWGFLVWGFNWGSLKSANNDNKLTASMWDSLIDNVLNTVHRSVKNQTDISNLNNKLDEKINNLFSKTTKFELSADWNRLYKDMGSYPLCVLNKTYIFNRSKWFNECKVSQTKWLRKLHAYNEQDWDVKCSATCFGTQKKWSYSRVGQCFTYTHSEWTNNYNREDYKAYSFYDACFDQDTDTKVDDAFCAWETHTQHYNMKDCIEYTSNSCSNYPISNCS